MVIVSYVTFNSDAISRRHMHRRSERRLAANVNAIAEGGSSTIAIRIAGILAVLLLYWLDWYLPG